MEKEDYPDFVTRMVKKRMAKNAARARDEDAFLAQDVEDHLLDQGKSIKDLTEAQLDALKKDLRRSI